jgi:hypothetical protein
MIDEGYVTPADMEHKARQLGSRLYDRVQANYDWTQVVQELRQQTGEFIDDGRFRRDLSQGRLQPPMIYALCRIVRYNEWEAASALGVLPEDPFAWLNRRLRISSTNRIEKYLRNKQQHANTTRHDLKMILQARLPPGYRLSVRVVDRGVKFRQPYHTYFIFTDEGGEDAASTAAERERQLWAVVEAALSEAQVNAHWEPSDECKPDGHQTDAALIYESHFDNRAPTGASTAVGPLVILGVYYSGAKDVAVVVSKHTGLGAIDVSRYVAESLVAPDPFRHDWGVIAATFWNALEGDLARNMVVTVDDYRALIVREIEPHHLRKLSARAYFLELTEEGLRYAAYRLACNRREPGHMGPPTAGSVASSYDELKSGQQSLRQLARKHFRYVTPFSVDGPEPPSPSGHYRDAVDQMFDRYHAIADDIVERLSSR